MLFRGRKTFFPSDRVGKEKANEVTETKKLLCGAGAYAAAKLL